MEEHVEETPVEEDSGLRYDADKSADFMHEADTNKDGMISKEERDAAFSASV